MSAEVSFPAMGSTAHVVAVGDGDAEAVAYARARLDELERGWSRFLPDSDISRLNRGERLPEAVSGDTALLLRRAHVGRRATSGRFDPRLSSGFDPGAIGKGLAADLVTDELVHGGAEGACVNVGGDLRVGGAAPGGGAWLVDVEDVQGARLALTDGAVATSGATRQPHHLVDPATGRPTVSDVRTVTVVAGRAWWAEVLATAAFVAGIEAGCALVEREAAAALFVDHRGRVHHAGGIHGFLDERQRHGACGAGA